MVVQPSFDQLIAELGEIFGMADLRPSNDGVCQLVIDGRHVVHVVHVGARGLVLLSCRLSDYGVDAHQAQRMLRANFLQAGRGLVMCVAADGRPYVQVALEQHTCKGDAVCETLELLLNEAERWQKGESHQAGPRGSNIFLQSV